MKIKWIGHACVLITSESGTRIITDPYIRRPYSFVTRGALIYGDINESADIVVVTHEHPDHNNVAAVGGNPEIVRGSELRDTGTVKVKGIEFKCIPCYHDGVSGERLGENNVFCFEVDGLRICHTGDLGHPLSDEQIAELGDIDILLLCVGLLAPRGEPKYFVDDNGQRIQCWNQYIINADVANEHYDQLKPKVLMPIHFGSEKCTFNLVTVDEFLQGKKNVSRLDTSEVQFKKGELPADTRIILLKPAR